ncbi:MAG: tetratricopeptide repeat protein [Candidatus Riflebacteria bacterium]|nr:tetratricopeptide repeat protein [Candidatus Riflebacteria bacterium]
MWVRQTPVFASGAADGKSYASNFGVSDSQVNFTDGSGKSNQINWTLPPERLTDGQEVTLRMDSSSNGGAHLTGGWNVYCYRTEELKGIPYWVVETDSRSRHTHEFSFRFRPGKDAKANAIGTNVGHLPGTDTWAVITWSYVKQGEDGASVGGTGTEERGGRPGGNCHLAARFESETLEVVPEQISATTHIWVSGWKHDTDRPVRVAFPTMLDGFGFLPGGLQVTLGPGDYFPSQMGGVRGPDGRYGIEYPCNVFISAGSGAVPGTVTVPILVSQAGCGEAHIELAVRVVPSTDKLSGPSRTGTGAQTGPSAPPPAPVTQASLPGGFTARLGAGRVVICPGHNSETVNVEITGWRRGTGDQVEVRLVEEGSGRGNLGNEIVGLPAVSALDPANLGSPSHVIGIGFRAMPKASTGTTAVHVVVRQRRPAVVGEPVLFDQLDLILAVVVADPITCGAARSSGATVSPPPVTALPPTVGPAVQATPAPTPPPTPAVGTLSGPVTADPEAAVSKLIDDGDAAREKGDHEAAIAIYKEAIKLAPGDGTWRNRLGESEAARGRWADAESQYRQAVRLDPKEADYRASLALSLLRQGRRDEALTEARQSLDIAERQGAEVRKIIADAPVFRELGLQR